MKKLLTAAFGLCLATFGGTQAYAGTIDLTTAFSSGTANGAIYTQVPDQSTGTGVIDPFLRVQDNGEEDGYNYNTQTLGQPPAEFEVKTGTWTHDFLLSDVGEVTINGVVYYQFLLDINQTKPNSLLTLTEVQIYTRNGALTNLDIDTLAELGQLGTLRFDMDLGADGDTTVLLDYNLNPGSGAGDMLLYVPKAGFGSENWNVYFYTQFATPQEPNDGFEEWANIVGVPVLTPDGGSTVSLLGVGLLGLGMLRRRFSTR